MDGESRSSRIERSGREAAVEQSSEPIAEVFAASERVEVTVVEKHINIREACVGGFLEGVHRPSRPGLDLFLLGGGRPVGIGRDERKPESEVAGGVVGMAWDLIGQFGHQRDGPIERGERIGASSFGGGDPSRDVEGLREGFAVVGNLGMFSNQAGEEVTRNGDVAAGQVDSPSCRSWLASMLANTARLTRYSVARGFSRTSVASNSSARAR